MIGIVIVTVVVIVILAFIVGMGLVPYFSPAAKYGPGDYWFGIGMGIILCLAVMAWLGVVVEATTAKQLADETAAMDIEKDL